MHGRHGLRWYPHDCYESLTALDDHMHEQDFPPADPDSVSIISMDGHEKVTVRACRKDLPVPTRGLGDPAPESQSDLHSGHILAAGSW